MSVSMPPAIAAKQAMLQQAVALSIVKQNAEMERSIAGLLESAIRNVPASGSRGSGIDFSI
ncbi:MAG: hypothetical protein EOM26_08105 [Alphaproteobacteria bacterium]|nr:hypothetical protein [Alphaproteobacteria bacterium]